MALNLAISEVGMKLHFTDLLLNSLFFKKMNAIKVVRRIT